MTRQKKLPENRLGRLVRYASLGARTGASLLFTKEEEAMEAAAERAAEVLGTMRGLAAKVGQMASYVDGFVPEPHRQAYETALKSLRTAAPTSSPEKIRNVVEEDLKAPIDKLFAEWETEPFASASIGQVHRARLENGLQVAVKVQHPGIAKAIESDFANASVIKSMVATVAPKNVDPKRVFEEVKERFTEELDYPLEAQRQQFFINLHKGDPFIHIPNVVMDRVGPRVLTTELAHGKTLEQAAELSESERRQYAEVLWRFVFKGNLVGKLFNADPHPGNYLFGENGKITFLDFGCCQPMLHAERAVELHLAALAGDETRFERAAAAILQTRGGSFEKKAVAYTRQCFVPLFETPFNISRPYVTNLVGGIRELKNEVFAKDKSFTQLPPGMVLMNRLQFGFYSVLARLDVEVDYARVELNFLKAAGMA
ncbi:MAG: AarF/ABC1/UbiB kinase family protein [Polyangiaceae bacterium]|nr:AarF/ABC1/UbiB kinase family protein [Polyangiaceae bacterium]